MADTTLVRYSFEGEKFEILVKPDPALEYKLGKKKDISSVLISDEIYTDYGKGTKPSTEKLLAAFKTEDKTEIAQIMFEKGDLNLTTDQRRKMIDQKRRNFRPRNQNQRRVHTKGYQLDNLLKKTKTKIKIKYP